MKNSSLSRWLGRNSIVNALEVRVMPILRGTTVGINILGNGHCNLSCPSCPVGNFDFGKTKTMDLPLFKKILDKVQREVKIRWVWISEYSEPLLHPKCHEFISELTRRGLPSFISANLNYMPDMNPVLGAGLTGMRISLSGFTQEYYGYYHTGGNIDVVKRNMERLSETNKKYHVPVTVFFHRYRDNVHEMSPMREFAKTLGFDFDSCQAYYRPIEKALSYVTGVKIPQADTELIERLAEPLLVRMGNANKIKSPCRSHYKQLEILSDGTIPACCHSTFDENKLSVDGNKIKYLDWSIKDIRKIQRKMKICDTCIAHGAHVLYNNNESVPDA